MNKNLYFLVSVIYFLSVCEVKGQFSDFRWKRSLEVSNSEWTKIEITSDILSKLNNHTQAIRVYGITNKDTIEMPYVLKICKEENIHDTLSFNLINQVKNNSGRFLTFQLPEIRNCDEINLEFKEKNFDCEIKLEGSQYQKQWFMIGDSFRVVSIYNSSASYKFTKLEFDPVAYKYFRLFYPKDCNLTYENAYLLLNKASACIYDFYKFSEKVEENKITQQTIINIRLAETNPVSVIKLKAEENFDYYRPLRIDVLTDSFPSPGGWHYTYTTVYRGTLSSMEKTRFLFESTICKEIKIIIDNGLNIPLHYNHIEVKGNNYVLIARLNGAERYYLVYGNDNAVYPHYDIEKFMDRIPADPPLAHTGNEVKISDTDNQEGFSLFKNSWWLFGLLGIIVLILGGFTIKMLKSENSQ